MQNALKVTIVRSNGSVDVAATLAGATNELTKLIAQESSDAEVIAEAVATVWAQNPTAKAMKIDDLANLAVVHIPGVTLETREGAVDQIKDYVRTATDLMLIARGKNGGVQFLARLSAEELASVQAQVAKANAKRAA